MPAKARWLLRVPHILQELSGLDIPVLDRAACERLFGLRRRRTIDLIRGFGGYQAGRTFLIDRPRLIAQLEQLRESPDFNQELQRKERLSDRLESIRRLQTAARVNVPVEQRVAGRPWPNLPDGVGLTPGALQIQFRSPEELLGKLFALAQAIADDYEAFEKYASSESK